MFALCGASGRVWLSSDGRGEGRQQAMHGRGHAIARMDTELGWKYVRLFMRNLDGSLGLVD